MHEMKQTELAKLAGVEPLVKSLVIAQFLQYEIQLFLI
jgi:hypothetical protein